MFGQGENGVKSAINRGRAMWLVVAGIALCLPACASAACWGDSEVVAEYLFFEGSGSTAINTGIDGDDGNAALINGVTLTNNTPPSNGNCGWSIKLLSTGWGSNTPAVEASSTYDPLAGASNFTIMAWVRRTSQSTNHNISARILSDISTLAITNTTAGVDFRLAGTYGLPTVRINGNELGTTVAGVAPNSNVWRHVAVVYDGTRPATNTLTRNVHFYVDGIQRGDGNTLQNVVVGSNTSKLTIGNSAISRASANLLVGNMDDVIVLSGVAPEAVGNGKTNDIIQCYMNLNDDIERPEIDPPANAATNTDPGQCSSTNVNLGQPTASDNCGVASIGNNAPVVFPSGETLVVWTATDYAGNTASCTQAVIVVDAENPQVACPPDVVVETEGCWVAATNVNLGEPEATDNCDISMEYNTVPASFPIGTTLVAWYAVDAAGNHGACTQRVTVVPSWSSDCDGDGYSDGLEAARGADPYDPESIPLIGQIYVDASRADDSGFATNWATAKKTIQAAVDISLAGETVLVTNGIYETGAKQTPGHLSLNRVVITNDVEVRSVNGPDATIIRGQGPRGTNAVRGVYMTAGKLIGFTVTNCHTRLDGNGGYDQDGGGINMFPSTAAVVSNCIISGNSAHDAGGTEWGNLYNSLICGNSAERAAGGVGGSTKLFNCVIYGNTALEYGGGLDQSAPCNCTVAGNSSEVGGGAFNCQFNNVIACSNNALFGTDVYLSACQYTCASPLQAGAGNIAEDPLFVDAVNGDYRLQTNSPCIDVGNNEFMPFGMDFDGTPRPLDGDNDGENIVDMGAYEHLNPNSDTDGDGMPDGWEAQYDLNVRSGLDGALAGWWKLDDGEGTNAVNSAMDGYQGELQGFSGATNGGWVEEGMLGGALAFDGSDDWVRIAQEPAILTGGPFTVSAWAQLDGSCTSDWPEVVSDRMAANRDGYCMGFDSNNVAYARMGEAGWLKDTNAVANEWTWLVLEYDGAQMQLYRDGVSVGGPVSASFTAASNGYLSIGNGQNVGSNEHWKGQIDDVRLYRSAVGTNGIAGMYDAWEDLDGDGLLNMEESRYLTNPRNVDSDGDGLDDAKETNIYGTDPNLADSDHDGMTDNWEIDNGFNPNDNSDGGNADADGDGLTNAEEEQAGTDPHLADTDGDKIHDDEDPLPSTKNCDLAEVLTNNLTSIENSFKQGTGQHEWAFDVSVQPSNFVGSTRYIDCVVLSGYVDDCYKINNSQNYYADGYGAKGFTNDITASVSDRQNGCFEIEVYDYINAGWDNNSVALRGTACLYYTVPLSVEFSMSQDWECWSSNGTYNAGARLTTDSFTGDRVDWSLFTMAGSSATINSTNGLVTFGEGGGRYQIRASAADLATCYDSMILVVPKVDIQQTTTNVCKDCGCTVTLNVTSNSYSPGGYVWSSSPPGITGRTSSITFSPSNLPPATYTVYAKSAAHPECFDTCTVNVLKVEITEPNGNPTGDNQFVFTGLPAMRRCNVPAVGTTHVSGQETNLVWTIDSIPDTILSSSPTPAAGPNVTFTYTGEPENNSDFVPQRQLILAHSLIPNCQATTNLQFFFGAEYANIHEPAVNWFVYWKQDGVVADLQQFQYESIIPGLTGEYGAYDANADICYISPDAYSWAGHQSYSVTNSTGGVVVIGLDLGADYGPTNRLIAVASVCAHELKHKEIHGWLIADPVDSDLDGIPDAKELALGLDPNTNDTYNVAGAIDPSYAPYGDGEFLARQAEIYFGAVTPTNDWSSYGCNWRQ